MRVLIVSLFAFLLLAPAASQADVNEFPDGGIFSLETINNSVFVTDISFAVDISGLTASPSATTLDEDILLQQVLAELALDPTDVENLTTGLVFDGQTNFTETTVNLSEVPGTVFIGDFRDPFSIVVIVGAVTVTTINTTTTTDFYTFST